MSVTREEKIAMLTDAEIADKKNELWFNKSQGEDLSGNERVIAILINDLQQTRQDLRGSLKSIVEFGGPHVQEEARRLLEQYGWEGDT